MPTQQLRIDEKDHRAEQHQKSTEIKIIYLITEGPGCPRPM